MQSDQGLLAAPPGALAASLGGGAMPPPAGASAAGGDAGEGDEGGADNGGGVPPVSAPAGVDLPASLQPVSATNASMATVSPSRLHALGTQDGVATPWDSCALVLCCG